MSARTSRVAARDATCPQPQPARHAMRFNGFDGVGRTCRCKAALLPHPGAQEITIKPDRCDEQGLDHRAIRHNKASASRRTRRFKAVRLQGSTRTTRRKTRSPGGSSARRWRKASRSTRLIALRVTARGACRFGTIRPNRAGVVAATRGRETTNIAPLATRGPCKAKAYSEGRCSRAAGGKSDGMAIGPS